MSKIYLIIGKIFILSALLIISNNNLALKDDQAREEFYILYTDWLYGFFDKAVFLTGYIIKSKWLPPTDLNNTTMKKDNIQDNTEDLFYNLR